MKPRSSWASALAVLLITTLVASTTLTQNAWAEPAGPDTAPGPRVELKSKRSATSATYRNADGSLTSVLHSSPVHFRDGQAWRPISSNVVPDSRPGYAWRNEANSFDVSFKDRLVGQYMRFSLEEDAFTLSLQGAASSAAATALGRLDNAGTNRKRTSTLAYADVFAGVSLHYDIQPQGVKETLILDDANAPVHYRFLLEPEGKADEQLGVREQSDGSWAFVKAPHKEPLFVLEAPFVLEGAEERMVATPSRKPVSMDVSKAGAGFAVDLKLDREWLSDPAREFPIQVDPTITVQPTTEDASFSAGCGDCTPFLNERLYMGPSDTSVWRTALQFDLGAVPAGARVTDAQLGLYYDGRCISATAKCWNDTSQRIDAHKMTAAWSTSSRSSQLAFQPTPISSFTLDGTNWPQWMGWNVTTAVEGWLNGSAPNFGFLMKKSVETLTTGGPTTAGRRSSEPSVMPKLEITYVSDAVDLLVPDTLHSDGADLDWTRFSGAATGSSFEKYEIHRGTSPAFTPSAATLLATIRDVDDVNYRDTTAAPNKTFTYKVVANTSVSNPQSVTLPADGQATKALQPDPIEGKAADFSLWSGMTNCANYGADDDLWVGTYATSTSSSTWRSALAFDLSDIPTGAGVSTAKLSLWRQSGSGSPGTVDVHRVTRAWNEGTGNGNCTDNGATWYSADGALNWSTNGGDFDTAAATSKTAGTGGWDDFDVTGLVQSWAAADTSNLGLLLKTRSESLGTNNRIIYQSDDQTVSPTLRPKLQVNYVDGSHAQGPVVDVSTPSADEVVSGEVTLTAAATDDRRVESVELLVDGAVVGLDTTVPYQVDWATTSVGNGPHTVSARAIDDAGNQTTSDPISVRVLNSAPPTVSLTSPSGGASVNGTLTVSANASDDVGVEQVEFFVDGNRIGEVDTAAPYAVSWSTLDGLQPTFDGTHELTARAYDEQGQRTISAPATVTVANATSPYLASWTSTAAPQAMTYDPASADQTAHGMNVTVGNNGDTTWSEDVVLRYRWLAPDGTVISTSPDISLGGSVRRGRSTTATALVEPPTLPSGVDKAQYLLRFDLFEKSTGKYFSGQGNKPFDNPVIVNKAIEATALGLEHYYSYDGEPVGAGMVHMANVASGNSLLQWNPSSSPGRGLSTVVGLTYNSLEDRSESPIGNNFSLSMSSLTRFGLPLDIHPNKADEIAGNAKKYIEFTDGDGTTHRFTQNPAGGWDEPPGVHLYLRRYSSTEPQRAWALTRPDRVTFFYDDEGFPTFVEDKNGNSIRYTYEDIAPGDDPGNVKRRIVNVTDAAGLDPSPATNRSYTLDYYTKTEAKKAQVRGKLQSITDHDGSAWLFDYYEDGNLLRVTQQGGTTADGISVPDRSITFTYTTSDGTTGAIPDAANRVNPEPKTPNQSTRLFSVRDPRGNETTFSYYGPGSAQQRWKLKTRTNRTGQTTTYGYDLPTRLTTVTAPASRTTKYEYDPVGQVTTITDPKGQDTELVWDADRNVTKLIEPTGKFTEYAFNNNGYPTDFWDQLRNHTKLTYENLSVDAADTASAWKTGRSIPHLSQVATKTSPRGTATTTPTDDYQWDFGYDAEGNLTAVNEPEGSPRYTTRYTYNADGTVATVTDARNHTTRTDSYDANGLPTKVTDALGQVTQFGYDADGRLRWVQDPRHAGASGGDPTTYRSYFYYDAFHRMRRQSAPKHTAGDAPLVWTAAEYDAGDNIKTAYSPTYGHEFVAGPSSTFSYDEMDRQLTSTNPEDETTRRRYDPAGRLVEVTSPRGVNTADNAEDHAVFYTYDLLDRVTRTTRYDTDASPVQALHSHYCYDVAGDMVSATAPKADVADLDCAAPPSYTTKRQYDAAHRLVATIDPGGRRTAFDHDADGNTTTVTNPLGDATTRTYDARGLVTRVVEPLTDTRDVTTLYRYDATGHMIKQISPRGYDASADKVTFSQFVTDYTYDPVGQLTSVALPIKTGETRTFIHRAYDAGGNLTTTTLADPADSLAGVPQEKKTTLTYFDTGWIKSTTDHVNPQVSYDYNARGQQTLRGAGSASPEAWIYADDGMLVEHRDRRQGTTGGQKVTYSYNADNQLIQAVDRAGITAPDGKPIEVQVSYDSLSRVAKTRHRKEGAANFTFTSMDYDLNSNVIERRDDGTETAAGAVVDAAQRHVYTYDQANWLTSQQDFLSDGCQQIDNTFTDLGREATRVIRKATQACDASPTFSVKQSTEWTYFDNAKLKTLTTRSGPLGTGDVKESHDVEYVDAGIYVNGHRTKDVFTRKGPSAACNQTACTETYAYDGRDRLTQEKRSPGSSTDYKLDSAGNLVEKSTAEGTTYYEYAGMQLSRIATGSPGNYIAKYDYDVEGNLDCITTPSYSGGCSQAGSGSLIADYSYDYLNRLSTYTGYSGGTVTDKSTYEYDPLDRVLEQTETHDTSPKRTTEFSYLGLTDKVTREQQAGDPTKDATKSYSYDTYGHRISMTSDPADGTKPTETFTYGYDVHGSVSMLLDQAGQAKASYGYDAYGNPDEELTAGDPQDEDPLNPFRYTGKRYDSGSNTLDMGARRFGPDTSRFLQADQYRGALANLGLSLDPLTGNRYALAGGNPLSYLEWDGHMLIADGSGGGSTSPSPSQDSGGDSGGDDGGISLSSVYNDAKEGAGDAWETTKEVSTDAGDLIAHGAGAIKDDVEDLTKEIETFTLGAETLLGTTQANAETWVKSTTRRGASILDDAMDEVKGLERYADDAERSINKGTDELLSWSRRNAGALRSVSKWGGRLGTAGVVVGGTATFIDRIANKGQGLDEAFGRATFEIGLGALVASAAGAAGVACGPGAPVCVPLLSAGGGYVGGELGGWAGDSIWGKEND